MYIVLILVGILALFVVLFIFYEKYEQNKIKVTIYEMGTKYKNSKDLLAVQISDLHSKCFGENNIDLINKINEIKPDVVFLTGDIIDRNSLNYDIEKDLIKKLLKKYKVFYVLGNHELSLKYINLREYLLDLNSLGVKILLNEKVSLSKDIDLYGINYYTKDKENVQILQVNNLLKDIDEEKVNILLTHNPDDISVLKKYKLDFVFAGHIHGGLIRLFNKGIFSPNGKLFPKYSSGKYSVNSTDLIVNTGLGGNSYSKIRVFNKPEIVVLNLRKNVVKKVREKK